MVNIIEENIEETVDEDGFVSPKDATFVVAKDNNIPILDKNIKILYDENESLRFRVSKLEEQIEFQKQQLYQVQTQFQKLIDKLSRMNY